MELGETFYNKRVRYHSDGTFSIRNLRGQGLSILDENFDRVPGTRPRWFMKFSNSWLELKKPFRFFKVAHIVGKGPSLDSIKESDLASGMIFGINEAASILSKKFKKTIVCAQQDTKLGNIYDGKMIVSAMAATHYRDQKDVYVYNPAEISYNYNMPTVICLITMLEQLGFNKFRFWAFDAKLSNTDYAKSVGYHPAAGGIDPGRFLAHIKAIEELLEGKDFEFKQTSPG